MGTVLRYTVNPDGPSRICDASAASAAPPALLALAPRKDAAIVINYWDAISRGRRETARPPALFADVHACMTRRTARGAKSMNREDTGESSVGRRPAHISWHECGIHPDLWQRRRSSSTANDPDQRNWSGRDLHR